MRLLAVISGALLAFACSRASSPGRAPVPDPIRVARFGPGSARYRAVSRIRVEQEINGRAQTTLFRLVYFTTIRTDPETSGLRLTITLDSIQPDSGGLLSASERFRAKGARFSGQLRPDGEVTGLSGADSLLPGRLRLLVAGFRQLFPRIPPGGAEPGQSWIDTTETRVSSMEADVTHRLVNTHGVVAWSVFAGRRALHLHTDSRYTSSGTGHELGQAFTLQGTGMRATNQYLSGDGWYLGGEVSDTSTVTVKLTQMGISIPGRQIRTDTLEVVP